MQATPCGHGSHPVGHILHLLTFRLDASVPEPEEVQRVMFVGNRFYFIFTREPKSRYPIFRKAPSKQARCARRSTVLTYDCDVSSLTHAWRTN